SCVCGCRSVVARGSRERAPPKRTLPSSASPGPEPLATHGEEVAVGPEAQDTSGGGEILADLGKHAGHRRLSVRAVLRDPVGAPPELFEKPDAVVTLGTLAVGASQGALELTALGFGDQALARGVGYDPGQEQRGIATSAV